MSPQCHRPLWHWLGQCVLVISLIAFGHSKATRSGPIEPPYPLSFDIDSVAGSAKTYGPNDTTGIAKSGRFYGTLTLHNGVLFIGGESKLFSALPDSLETVEYLPSPPESTQFGSFCKTCKGNYIRIIQPLSDEVLLVCGTGSSLPKCRQISAANLSAIGEPHTFRIDKVAPSSPLQNSSWLLLKQSNSSYQVFAGTYLINSFGQMLGPAIVRANVRTSPERTTIDVDLKTKRNPFTVLNRPQFVGDPIEYNGRIYFFFREFASEHINAGKILYSRVAMVCKDEIGGRPFTTYTEEHFVTFAKARLECSIPGEFPYDYNNIQDVHQSTVHPELVFAVFSTWLSGPASSAVCAYRLDDIERKFIQSPFKALVSDMELWTEVNQQPVRPRQTKCPITSDYDDIEYGTILRTTQLIADSVRHMLQYHTTPKREGNRGRYYNGRPDQERDGPLLVATGERFTQIVVQERVQNSTDVFFIGTENGTVLKTYFDSVSSEARIVEEISLNTQGTKSPVLTMLMSGDDQAVFVGTDTGVFRVPLQHCRNYTTCQTCLDARDPYCRWINDECAHSSDGLQDLGKGSSSGLCAVQNDVGIIIHRKPGNNKPIRVTNIPDQPVHLYLLAESTAGSNLRVVGGLTCGPCGVSLPFAQRKSSCSASGREFLMLTVDSSSITGNDVGENCSCVYRLATDGGETELVQFDLIADNSETVNASEASLAELMEFDINIAAYKYNLREWKNKVAESCELTGLDECSPRRCSGRTRRQQLNTIPGHEEL